MKRNKVRSYHSPNDFELTDFVKLENRPISDQQATMGQEDNGALANIANTDTDSSLSANSLITANSDQALKDTQFPIELLKLVDSAFARKHLVMPAKRSDGLVTVFCADRNGRRVAENYLSRFNDLKFEFQYISADILSSQIAQQYSRLDSDETERAQTYNALSSQIRQIETDSTDSRRTGKLIFPRLPESSDINSSVALWLQTTIRDAYARRGTDILYNFITDPYPCAVCRVCIDGHYYELHREPMQAETYQMLSQVLKIWAKLNPNKRQHSGCSGVFRPVLELNSAESEVQLRAQFTELNNDHRTEGIAIRFQNKKLNLKVTDLGFLPSQMQRINDLMRYTHGAIIFMGRINSGKNTTMVVLLTEFNQRNPGHNMVFVEDPTEFELPFATQISLGTDERGHKLTFKDYVDDILRMSAHTIVLGEMRHSEAAATAIELASTGHLTYTTLHARNTVNGIARLKTLNVSDYMIANSVSAFICQRLVRKPCPQCVKERINPDIAYLEEYLGLINWQGAVEFTRPTGRNANGSVCGLCEGRRFHGRTGLFEILIVDEVLRGQIERGASTSEMLDYLFDKGHRTLWSVGLEKALRGETTIDEVLEQVYPIIPAEEGLRSILSGTTTKSFVTNELPN